MIIPGETVTPGVIDELVYKALMDLLKEREKQIRPAIRRQVNVHSLGARMSTESWIVIENRILVAFVAIRGYPIELGNRG